MASRDIMYERAPLPLLLADHNRRLRRRSHWRREEKIDDDFVGAVCRGNGVEDLAHVVSGGVGYRCRHRRSLPATGISAHGLSCRGEAEEVLHSLQNAPSVVNNRDPNIHTAPKMDRDY